MVKPTAKQKSRARGRDKFGKFGTPTREKYLEQLRQGVRRLPAARNVGVSEELVRLYRKAFPAFAVEEKSAEEESLDEVENAMHQAAISGNVRAGEFILCNRRPKRWQARRRHEVGGIGGVPIAVSSRIEQELRALTDDELHRKYQETLAAAESPSALP
jgi:hypothetical protein